MGYQARFSSNLLNSSGQLSVNVLPSVIPSIVTIRQDTTANLAATVLYSGEIAAQTDGRKLLLKGDGITAGGDPNFVVGGSNAYTTIIPQHITGIYVKNTTNPRGNYPAVNELTTYMPSGWYFVEGTVYYNWQTGTNDTVPFSLLYNILTNASGGIVSQNDGVLLTNSLQFFNTEPGYYSGGPAPNFTTFFPNSFIQANNLVLGSANSFFPIVVSGQTTPTGFGGYNFLGPTNNGTLTGAIANIPFSIPPIPIYFKSLNPIYIGSTSSYNIGNLSPATLYFNPSHSVGAPNNTGYIFPGSYVTYTAHNLPA